MSIAARARARTHIGQCTHARNARARPFIEPASSVTTTHFTEYFFFDSASVPPLQVERLLRDVNDWRKERRRQRKEMQRMQRRWELKRAQTAPPDAGPDAASASQPDLADAESFAVAFEPEITVIPPRSSVGNGRPSLNGVQGAGGVATAATAGKSAPEATVNGRPAAVAVEDNGRGVDPARRSSVTVDAPSLLTPTCEPAFPGDGSHDLLLLRGQLKTEEAEEETEGGEGRDRRPSEAHLQKSLFEEESHRVRLPSHTHAEVNDTRHEAGEIAPIAWIVIMAKVR